MPNILEAIQFGNESSNDVANLEIPSTAIRLQANGLLTYTDMRGARHEDLAEDEVVRLRIKEAKAAAAAQTRQRISKLHLVNEPHRLTPPKCPQCGSPTRQSRRSMFGVTGLCRADFHG